MKDKELIENSRLRERTGGYHKYVDAAEVHNPDPTSSHYISGKTFTIISIVVDHRIFMPVQNKSVSTRTTLWLIKRCDRISSSMCRTVGLIYVKSALREKSSDLKTWRLAISATLRFWP